jgi:glycosyltransferase involved in cell wall biosynthesis
MRVAFALPGLHRIDRGAEISFMAIADQLALRGHSVTLFGSGEERPGKAYRFRHVPSIPRERFERWPYGPMFRDETAYEEMTFAFGLLKHLKPSEFDVVGGCSYPFVNWVLRRPIAKSSRPKYVFITQNGDYPAISGVREYRYFGCDGIVCINPDYYSNNKNRWNAALIPNGVNIEKYRSAGSDRGKFNLPANKKIVLMVSAFIASKRVDKAIAVVSRLPGVHLVVAGNGPDRQSVLDLANKLLPGRFSSLTLPPDQMPSLYQSADAFLHMSQAESFGNVFIEALACGLPVVAHDIARHRWVVGETGFFVDTDQIDLTARAVEAALAASSVDKEKRRDAASKYDWSIIGGQYEQFFLSVLADKSVREIAT